MRILIAHNRYQISGGEDAVVENERRLLEDAGHEVRLHLVSNDQIQGLRAKVSAAWNLSYSVEQRRVFESVLREARPEVVHVHNTFPLLTTSIYDACEAAGVPVVQTLHNFRPMCANALLLRDGQPCELCVGGSAMHGVVHACYRGSRVATLPVVRMIEAQRRVGTWDRKVAQFIAPSQFTAGKFVEAGFPAKRITVKPHFVRDPGNVDKPASRKPTAVFVGRLSPEKGIRTLLEAWRDVPFALRIVGDGPELDRVRSSGLKHIELVGRLPQERVHEEMRQADLLIAPSECYETFGLVVVEAFANGTPALVSDHGSLAELVEPGSSGEHFRAGDSVSLRENARMLLGAGAELVRMSQAARHAYGERYSPKVNLDQLTEIYRQARPVLS